MNKKNLVVLCGGRSPEHEVSLQSAHNVIMAACSQKYRVIPVGIQKTGEWKTSKKLLLNIDDPKTICIDPKATSVTLSLDGSRKLVPVLYGDDFQEVTVDVVFSVVHGPTGEDGALQGLFEVAGVPYVGSGVDGSALAFDKDLTKKILTQLGLPVAKSFLCTKEGQLPQFDHVCKELGVPFFVKPCRMGSSVGVSKVKSEQEFLPAIKEALSYDHKVLIEEFIEGREIECAVLGCQDAQASLPGEIVSQHEFYSYDAKYIDEAGAMLFAPADLSKESIKKVQDLSLEAFRALELRGMARVDFFLKPDGRVVINEVNTLPGFTKISMYPKLWQVSGLSYGDLIDKLVELALKVKGR